MAGQTDSESINIPISSLSASASLGNASVRTGIAIELTPEANSRDTWSCRQ